MLKVQIKDLEVGMCLSADVCDLNGRFLIGKECTITEKHIKTLQAWGVVSVEIKGDGGDILAKEPSVVTAEYQNQITKLKTIFIHNDLEHPFISKLINETVKYLMNKTN